MRQPYFLAGDWGTSKLRLTLFRDAGDRPQAVASREGPGVKSVEDFETTFAALADEVWPNQELISVYLAGMAGASIGWREAPYVPCPADAAAVADHAITFDVPSRFRVSILPGLRCINAFGLPDLMRGEETQIIGATAKLGSQTARQLYCLPGTHVKWALVENGAIIRFETTLQGEMFEVLDKHTILTAHAPKEQDSAAVPGEAFDRAISLYRDAPDLSLSQALFSTRSLYLSGALPPEQIREHLSGLTIGADVRDVTPRFINNDSVAPPIIIVGAPRLTRLYARAFHIHGYAAAEVDGAAAAAEGICLLRTLRSA